jgi:hypothetical protein
MHKISLYIYQQNIKRKFHPFWLKSLVISNMRRNLIKRLKIKIKINISLKNFKRLTS